VSEKIGLYGGTFDPPHLGHLISAQAMAELLSLHRVIFLPAGQPPHKLCRPISTGQHRLAMLQLALADNPLFQIDDWELSVDGPAYTINTIRYFQAILPGRTLYWFIGADSLADLPTWYRFEELIDAVEIVTAWRGGLDIERVLADLQTKIEQRHYEKLRKNVLRTPMIEISASDIRRKIHAGQSIRYLVAPAVEQYIRREGLYR